MRNLLFVFLLMLSAGFMSCQKELTLTNPHADSTSGGGGTTPGSTNGDLVIKVYGKSPAPSLDSNVSYYTYNSVKRVISRHIMLYAYGQSTDTWNGYERNGAGPIVKSRQYLANNPFLTDTVITIHHYSSGTTPTLLSSVQSQDFLGLTLLDSIVYTYNSSGKVTKTEDYQSNFLIPVALLTARSIFTYDAAGNVSKVEQYSVAGTVATLSSTQTFEWDNKTEPLGYTEAESLVVTGQPAPKHNSTKITIVSSAVNSVNTYTYTYNSANKPASSVSKAVNTNFPDLITNFTIYYQ